MAAPAYLDHTTGINDVSPHTTLVLAAPSGTGSGMYQLAFVGVGSSSGTVSTPSGWTAVGSLAVTTGDSFKFWVFESTTDTGNATFSVPNRGVLGVRITFENHDGPGTAQLVDRSGTTHAFASVTSSDADDLVITAIHCDNQSSQQFTAPSGFTEHVDEIETDSGEYQRVAVASKAAGSVGSQSGSWGSAVSDATVVFSVILAAEAAATQTVTPTGFSDTAAFGTPGIEQDQSVSPSGFADTASFGTPTLVVPQTVSPTGFSDTAAFGTPTVSGEVTPSGFADTASFGTPTLVVPQTVAVTGFADTAAFGTPSVSTGVPLVYAPLVEGTGTPELSDGTAATLDTTSGSATPGWRSGGPFGDAPHFTYGGGSQTGSWRFTLPSGVAMSSSRRTLTVSLWAAYTYPGSPGTFQHSQFFMSLTDGNRRFTIYPYDANDNMWAGIFSGGWSSWRALGHGADDDSWHHWVFTFNGDATTETARLWKDGVEVTTNFAQWDDGPANLDGFTLTDLYVGGDHVGGQVLEGSIQELYIYDRELSSTEITSLYDAGFAPQTVEPSGFDGSSEAFGTPSVATLDQDVAPSGFDGSTATFGTPEPELHISPSAVTSTAGYGTPTVSLQIAVEGHRDAPQLGTPTVVLSIDQTIAPVGFAVTFRLGRPTVLLTELVFEPPTTTGYGYHGSGSILDRYKRRVTPVPRGLFVWLDSEGTWHTGEPSRAQILDATTMYFPGRRYVVSEDEADTLEAAGFTVQGR